MKWLKSLFTDKDWDFDITKIIGFCLIVIGIVAYFLGRENWQWFIVTGAGSLASGKFSQEG